jgi:hypothetical protein
MTLILSGTDGLSDIDGSAATPAIRGTDANTGIFFPAADTIAFAEGGAEVARFDSSGNLLVGTTTQATGALLTVNGSIKGTITSGTAVASTSGTSIDFTSIPSWVKRITVMFNGVSISGGANYLIQLGDSGGFETSGYTSVVAYTGSANGKAVSTSGFICIASSAGQFWSGQVVITLVSGNIYVESGCVGDGSDYVSISGGTKTLSGTLDRVRITTTNGTDTFDAGSVNIMYEG